MKLYDESIEQLIILAEDAVFDGNYTQAKNLLDSGLMDEPGYPKLHYTLAWMYHYYQINLALAERHYLLTIYFDKAYFDAYEELTSLYLEERKYKRLVDLMEKAGNVKRMDQEFVLTTLGQLAERQGRFGDAIHFYKKAMMHCMDNYNAKELKQHVKRTRFKRFKMIFSNGIK